MANRIGNIELPEDEQPKKKMGRPPGARNRKGFLKIIDKNYSKLESMLNDEQRRYMKRLFAGLQQYDPVVQAEIFMLLYQLYITDVFDKAMNHTNKETGEKTPLVTQDIAQTLGQYRMGLKDLEDMKHRREVQKAKASDDERVVDPTRKSTMAVIQDIVEESLRG